MALSEQEWQDIDAFRWRFEERYRGDARFSGISREDRDDRTTLTSRFQVAERLWVELAVRPLLPQIRAGIVTDDRWLSEELEETIEESGDTMPEFIEFGFEEAGLSWKEPPVEHYRDQGKWFYFATALDLSGLGQLADEAVQDRARRMFEGYYAAFAAKIRKLAAK